MTTGADTGSAGAFDFESFGTMINDAIASNTATQISKEQARGADPCTLEIAAREALDVTYRPVRRDAGAAVQILATELRNAVQNAIDTKGSGLGFGGIVPFGQFLFNQGVIDVSRARQAAGTIPWGMPGPNPMAIAAFDAAAGDDFQRRLGPGRPSGRNEGYRLGPGAYLYGYRSDLDNLELGRLRGSRVRRAYDLWVRLAKRSAWPTIPGAPSRAFLADLAGQSAATYPFWADGDRPARGSRLYDLNDQIEQLERLARTSARSCLIQRTLDRRDQNRALDIAADLERRRIETPILLGAAALITLIAWRRKNGE